MPFCNSSSAVSCTHGLRFVCSSSGTPTCELLGLPVCKNNNVFFPGTCSQRGLSTDNVNIQIIFALPFPDVIQLPLNNDEFVGEIGYAFPGSNPSYEVKTLTTTTSNIKVNSVDLTDSLGMIFENISFKIIKLEDSENEFILTVVIPEDISKGKAAFTLNLESGEQLTGNIEIIASLNDLEITTIKNPNKRTHIDKPVINNLFSTVLNKKMNLILRGKSFVSRQIFYNSEDSSGGAEELFVANSDIPDPHTAITIFPSSLNAKIVKKVVRKNGKFMKVFVEFPDKITKEINAVIVVITPKGIVSKSFVIKPGTSRVVH